MSNRLRNVSGKFAKVGMLWYALGNSVLAQVPTDVQDGIDAAGEGVNAPSDLVEVFGRVVNTILFVVGAIAVLMLIVGGIRYVVSGGNQENVTAAKNTIMYALIGLVVAILAFAMVNFITDRLLT